MATNLNFNPNPNPLVKLESNKSNPENESDYKNILDEANKLSKLIIEAQQCGKSSLFLMNHKRLYNDNLNILTERGFSVKHYNFRTLNSNPPIHICNIEIKIKV